MYLISIGPTDQISLTNFPVDNVPCYAILSHTWGTDGEELTFQDLKSGAGQEKAGYRKIRFCAQQTAKDGLHHFWIDTCCIDKTNQNELNEAIASMFRWYNRASKCYVYLGDVSTKKRKIDEVESTWEAAFRGSRWFTRGWTLQELLAPKVVEFFSAEGDRLGDKQTLEQNVHDVTGIPVRALRGALLSDFSIDERMRWAKKRQTTRPEDGAYCLLGIFNVFMVPLYGERENALIRLRNEIEKADPSQKEDIAERLRISSAAPDRLEDDASRHGEDTATLLEGRRQLLESLAFEQMDLRHSNIKKADPTTCQWLLRHVAYEAWIDHTKIFQHRGFLWIAGKPGAGKSTIMKYVLGYAIKNKAENEIIISFFFNARGHDLEKSTTGMYRALLSQLLQKATTLQIVLDSVDNVRRPTSDSSWTVEQLCELLLSVIERLGSRQLTCFIDALDECDEREVQEMVQFFETLSDEAAQHGLNLHICFASRHYPAIDIKRGLRLVLEDERGHTEDLVKYVQRHFHTGKGKLIQEIRQEICQKANGVFLWAVLVVGILNDEIGRGRMFAVKKRLDDIPPKLSDLFADILRRDTANMDELLFCLQWILFAKRPLKREEFYFAMTTDTDGTAKEVAPWDAEYVTTDDMDRFVLSSSKGLAELTKSKSPTVQFIHESVRDFLLKDNGLHALWPDIGDDPHSLSHDRLKLCCENYLSIASSVGTVSDIISRKAESEPVDLAASSSNDSEPGKADDSKPGLKKIYPFLEYACRHLFFHADEAAQKIAQISFLTRFRLSDWILLSNELEKFKIRRYTPNASLLYILAEYNCGNLIKAISQEHCLMDCESERYGYPFFAALAADSRDALEALIQHYGIESFLSEKTISTSAMDRRFLETKYSTPFSWALVNDHPLLAEVLLNSAALQFPLKKIGYSTPIGYAARKGYNKIVKLLIERQEDIPDWEFVFQDALIDAAGAGHRETVDILLNCGAHIDGMAGHNPLVSAATAGHYATVSLLLSRNAETEMVDYEGKTAILCAASKGHTVIVALLLDHNAWIGAKDRNGDTALVLAAENDDVATVDLLLDRHAEMETVNTTGSTLLNSAAINGRDWVVRRLLDHHACIEARDPHGNTALILSAGRGHLTTVDLLLDRDADIEAVNALGSTALIKAARGGSHQVVRTLLDHGANPHLSENGGGTALMWAVYSGSVMTTKLLLTKGVDPETRDKRGRTSLFYAVESRQSATAELLMANNANASPKDNTGQTPFSLLLKNDMSTLCRRTHEPPFSQKTSPREPQEYLRALRSHAPSEVLNSLKFRVQMLKVLVTRNGLPDEWRGGTDGKTALAWALEEGDWAIELLLSESVSNLDVLVTRIYERGSPEWLS